MKGNTTELGKEGEARARGYLEAQGYKVLHANWHYGHEELDLVCMADDMLVVVEVKTRRGVPGDRAEDGVTMGKIRRVVNATQGYMDQYNVSIPVRFDVVAVLSLPGDEWLIEHFKDAFLPPLSR